MLMNHIAIIFPMPWKMLTNTMVYLGYFTGVVMIYFLVEGYYYTRSRKNYFRRMLFFAFLSQIPFDLAFTAGGIIRFNGFNMMFTFCDWPVYAPVFTLLFVWSWNSAPRTKIAMALCLLFFAGETFLRGYVVAPLGQVIRISLLSILGMSLAAICLVFFYNGKRRKETAAFSKWFFYISYPAHLLLLGLLRVALPG